ncbi:hypothetical protein [Marinomonas mediterranea]|jgi:hypothetical protein|nr:hypothetical protein [Marinomonas mediterranea]WCN10164.1 hypothetical protein GV055_15235 [Marinomonas mediterranea]WCN14209.1 hypothetical protein GV054_15020 [Marinomonas mediterranea]WCN18265.1 hypothetical protein GV053_15110 [Marinomonas mediterranea MMB-1]
MNAEKSTLQYNEEQCLPKDDELVQVLQHLFSSTDKDEWPNNSLFDMELREELYYSLRDAFSKAQEEKAMSRQQTMKDFIDKEAIGLFYEQKKAFIDSEFK